MVADVSKHQTSKPGDKPIKPKKYADTLKEGWEAKEAQEQPRKDRHRSQEGRRGQGKLSAEGDPAGMLMPMW